MSSPPTTPLSAETSLKVSSSRSTALPAEASPKTSVPTSMVTSVFDSVSSEHYPTVNTTQAQQWRKILIPSQADEDGKLFIACPKKCIYGSNNIGGL